ncbi:type II toxin-antitoxin system RelE/ParE family toxin [Pseudomonas canadensis]|uniref:type II toxin-antitoxin system RelE/ParE family toxin n=1 Tax=Pseudomonas canadensis TaxID=915099 RepID=UPI003BA273A1
MASYLRGKQDQSNISQKDLIWFRAMAKIYESLNEAQDQRLLDLREFVEIRHDQKI